MTLSEYERRTLDGIETGCRAEDPGFRCPVGPGRRGTPPPPGSGAVRVRNLAGLGGAGDRRRDDPRPLSIGVIAACCGLVMIIAGTVAWARNRNRARFWR